MKRGQYNKLYPNHFDFGAHRKPYGVSSFNRLVRQYKANAKRRGLSFELTDDEVRTLTTGDCTYCGTAPRQVMSSSDSNGEYVYNGIDRVDPSRGYTAVNCVTACKYCNRAKTNMTEHEWFEFRTRLATVLAKGA